MWEARLREGDCGDDVVGWTDTDTGRYCRLEGPGTDMSGICKLDDGSTMLIRSGLIQSRISLVDTEREIEAVRSEKARVS